MTLSPADVREYLSRIGYAGPTAPTLEVLCTMQESHLLCVPFENLDIHQGRRIVLDPERIFYKVVRRKRGGFCYELNGLFHLLLQELGFRAHLAMGKVYDHDRKTYGADFDHMLILVEIRDETWLVDVGFGDFSAHPLKVLLDQPLADRNGSFLIERYKGAQLKVSRFSEKEERFLPLYLFSTLQRSIEDFAGMCLYHQISPDSHFTRQKICSMATPAGRITLTDHKLVVVENARRTVMPILDQAGFTEALARHFNIVL
jgi:N-hydroxyarylamine O-acetyltransferase